MLLALNGTDSVAWEELQSKVRLVLPGTPVLTLQQGRVLAQHLARNLSKFRDHLIEPRSPPPPTTAQR